MDIKVCFNCGSDHDISECNDSSHWIKCPRCLVSSMDGSGHSQSCRLKGTPSGIKSNIYALEPIEMFMMRVKNADDAVFILNKKTKAFEIVEENVTMLANCIDGIFMIGKSANGRVLIRFSATSMKRFSIEFAFLNENDWRYRFRAVITHQEGVLCFPMQRSVGKTGEKYVFPDENNTVLVLGIRSASENSLVGFRVLANSSGTLISDGYYGYVTWSKSMDLIEISPNLQSGGHKKSVRFSRQLYANDGLNTLSEVRFPFKINTRK